MDSANIRVDRRTVLKASAWAVPVVASAMAAPAQAVSPGTPPGVAARADWVDENPALTVESTDPGTPIPAGVYVFTTTGGVSPDAASFVTEPSLPGMVSPAPADGSTATVTLLTGHAITGFTAYVAAELTGEESPEPTLTVTLPTGGGATVSLLDRPEGSEPEEPTPSAVRYGPSGGHWPTRTPRPGDTFDQVIDVDPTWAAISGAIATATSQHPNGKVKIRVRPGVLANGGSGGAGSSAAGAVRNVGAVGRPWRILVVPRDGWGSVTADGPIDTRAGYAFVGVRGVTFAGFDLTNKSVLVRNSDDVALAWSTFGVLNVTANRGANTTAVEFVECVLPDMIESEGDRMAFRVADGNSIAGLAMSGCYVAPSYKADGSSSHTDSLQTSGTGAGSIRNLTFSDTAIFGSSSQAVQMQVTSGVTFERTLVLAGLRVTGRYPIPPGRHVMTGQNALWGDMTGAVTRDGVVLGSIHPAWSFASVTGTVLSHRTSATVASGAFVVDETLPGPSVPVSEEWFGDACPIPSRARLASIWAALRV